MSSSVSLRNERIAEESHSDHEPLLPGSERSEELELRGRSRVDSLPTAKMSVAFVTSIVCVFMFVLSTVLFGVLYLKVSESMSLPNWPKPSNSPLGEYSKAGVAADNNFCSEIGRDTLLQGGNAVEAAISTLFCIGVLDVQSAGLGGGHFLTFFNATTKKCHVIDARETAPKKSFKDMYRNRYEKAQVGWEAVAVPGEVHGMWTAYKNFGGNVRWKSLITPTIRLMKEGYPTSHALAAVLKLYEADITSDPLLSSNFINPKTKKVYKVGEQITTRQSFIKTLEILADAEDPVKEFYSGQLMKQMVDEFKQNKGIITEEDFRSYRSILRADTDVIYADFDNKRIRGCGPPPPSGAAVTLSILRLMGGFPMDSKNVSGNTDLFHRFIEANKFAYAKRAELGDMDFVKEALDMARNITSEEWAYQTRKLITEQAHPTEYYRGNVTFRNDHGTSHISVIDKYGNAVSLTTTVNLYLGARVMSKSTGIVFNDEMDDFSLPGHPNYFNLLPSPNNYIAPGKRPQSSMSPIILFSDKGILSIGGAGGSQIISGVSYAVMHLLFLNRNVKEAIDFPRLHNQLWPNYTEAESAFLPSYLTALEHRGQTFANSSGKSVLTAVFKSFKDSTVYANSDYRKGWESEPSGY